jgi:Flp pilus assembly protein CpaB
MTTIPSRRARGIALPHVDVRLLLGVALVAAAVAGGLAFSSAARQTTPLLVASREIAPGQTITVDDLTVTEARLAGALATLTIPESGKQVAVGRIAAEPIHAGALVMRPALGIGPTIGPDELAITIPAAANAVYPLLRPGDAVAVLATSDKGKPQSKTTTVLQQATVYDVGADANRITLGSGNSGADSPPPRPANVTLVVPRAQAEQVTQALVDSQLTLVLLARQGR